MTRLSLGKVKTGRQVAMQSMVKAVQRLEVPFLIPLGLDMRLPILGDDDLGDDERSGV